MKWTSIQRLYMSKYHPPTHWMWFCSIFNYNWWCLFVHISISFGSCFHTCFTFVCIFFRCLMQQNACLHVCVSQFACVHLYQCEQSLHVLIHLSECKRLNSSMCLRGYLYTWMLFFGLRHILNTMHWKCISVWVDASLWSADNAKADTVRGGSREGYSAWAVHNWRVQSRKLPWEPDDW